MATVYRLSYTFPSGTTVNVKDVAEQDGVVDILLWHNRDGEPETFSENISLDEVIQEGRLRKRKIEFDGSLLDKIPEVEA